MKIFKEWCIENNKLNLLDLYDSAENVYRNDQIGFSSGKLVNWKCNKCNNMWQATLNKMTQNAKGCPYCNHERPSIFYNLITEYPILGTEWNYDINKKLPSEYLPNSSKKVYWKCTNGHVWDSRISDRVRSVKTNLKRNRAICPYCNHERASNEYNLVTEYPNIAKQWDYINNGKLIPLNISPKSQKKVWWICEYNPAHKWADRVSNRTVLKRGCSICSKEFAVSFPSRAIYYYLRKKFFDCEIEYKILGKYVLDIYIPYYKIIIEYDGWYFHSDKNAKIREDKKNKILRDNGFELIRIKEIKEETEKITFSDNIIKYHLYDNYKNLDELINKLIEILENKTKCNIFLDIDSKRDSQKIEDLYYHTRKSNSFAVKKPELMNEWSVNNEILPDVITDGSKYKAKWICNKCSREYEATIYNRVKNNSGCPYCSNRKVCKSNSLETLFPQIARQWNYEKNGDLLPSEVTKGSDKEVWWICDKGHEWKTRVYCRTGAKPTNCPYCSGKYFTEETSLKNRYPELVNIWNFEKNGNEGPENFSFSSNKIVWWKCNKGHEWRKRINSIIRIENKDKCPYCRGKILCSDNSLATLNKELSKEWNYSKNCSLKPEDFLPSSKKKVWWICKNGHEWMTSICYRNKGTNCPYCAGLKVSDKNSFLKNADTRILKEWNYEKNTDITPESISVCSGKKIWWKCSNGHEWIDTVSHRTFSKRGCPYCSGRRCTVENSFAKVYPNLIKEWNYEKNNGKKPEEFSKCSAQKVWWKCENGHEWETRISTRAKGTNCPICWNNRRNKEKKDEYSKK